VPGAEPLGNLWQRRTLSEGATPVPMVGASRLHHVRRVRCAGEGTGGAVRSPLLAAHGLRSRSALLYERALEHHAMSHELRRGQRG
jgi:hypothetical protein